MLSEPDTASNVSLYELLGVAAPSPLGAGETRITATKETIDDDTEDVSDGDILNL